MGETRISTNEDDALLCPRCGNNYLHQSELIVFSRREDDPITIETRVTPSGLARVAAVPSLESRNPSARRNRLSILFACENCDADDLEFSLAQHKGNTFLSWRGNHDPGS